MPRRAFFFIRKNKRLIYENANKTALSFSSREISRLVFADDTSRPLVTVFPFLGIHWLENKEVIGKSYVVAVQSDRRTWFDISITKKGYPAKTITCRILSPL